MLQSKRQQLRPRMMCWLRCIRRESGCLTPSWRSRFRASRSIEQSKEFGSDRLLPNGCWRPVRMTAGMLRRRHTRSEEHTSELQSPCNLVCPLLLEKKKHNKKTHQQVIADGMMT